MSIRPLVTKLFARPFATETWRETGYLVLGTATGTIAFSVLIVSVTVGTVTALTILGLPVLLLCFHLVRATATLDRRRAALVLGRPIEARYRRPPGDGVGARLRTVVTDPQSWKDLAWLGVGGVLGFTNGILAAAIWALGITQLTTLVWWWIPGSHSDHDEPGIFNVDSWELAILASLSGLGICLVAPWVVKLLAFIGSWLARTLLGPGKRAQLEERVTELAESRAGALSLQSAELQRIERDLHDGAQARLVALAMDLGLAREKLEQSPAEAKTLIVAAHEEAKVALKELRELVRGVHPSILTDRGLDSALSALAARSPVPVSLSVELGGRLAPEVEAAAYFVVKRGVRQRREAQRRRDVPGRRRPYERPAPNRRQRRRRGGSRLGQRQRSRRARAARPRPRRHAQVRQPGRRPDRPASGDPVRVVIAEDLVLLREGIARLLTDRGAEVVAAVDNGPDLVEAVERLRPDVAVVDVRLPRGFRDEGLRAALEARSRVPWLPVLVLSQ
jgi:signal transduction histidine kinase